MSGTAAPRYAPDDPTVPKPWRGLVDGTTGYLYYWNPETNVTQYEKPVPPEAQLPRPGDPGRQAMGADCSDARLGSGTETRRWWPAASEVAALLFGGKAEWLCGVAGVAAGLDLGPAGPIWVLTG